MKPISRSGHDLFHRYVYLVIFGVAFGFVEAAVVYYLRHLVGVRTNYNVSSYRVLFNLGFIVFTYPTHSLLVNRAITSVEFVREIATIVMLLCLAVLAGSNRKQRFGAFLIAFATWDITYYIYLKIIAGWPSSLWTKDVFFLIPVPWVGPVITPLVISTGLLLIGTKLYLTAYEHK